LALIPAQHLVEAGSAHQLAGQHSRRAQLLDHVRDVDDRVAFVIVREKLLVLGFQPVVDLLAQPLAQLVDERARVQARESSGGDPSQQSHVAHIRCDRASDAGVLNLDGHCPALARNRPVHLSDGCSRERQWVPPRKDPLRGIAQLVHDHRARELRSHRRSVVLQSGHGRAKALGHVLVDVARHLTELHKGAFHGAELLRDVVSGAQGKLMAQLGATVHRGEDQSRRTRQVAAAHAQREPRQRRTPTETRLQHWAPAPLSAHARIRSSIRSRASRTPGKDSNAKSRAPMSWRTGSRSIISGGGASKPYIERAQAGRVPTATCPRSCQSSRVAASRPGGSRTIAIASDAAGVSWRSSTDSRYSVRAATLAGTWVVGTPMISANRAISAT